MSNTFNPKWHNSWGKQVINTRACLRNVGSHLQALSNSQMSQDHLIEMRDRGLKDIPPSHPAFDRTSLSDSAFIELLLFEIKELRAECEQKEKKLSEFKQLQSEIRVKSASVQSFDEIPQRSARRRVYKEDSRHVDRENPENRPEEIPKTEPHPEIVAHSVPLSENFKSGLSLAIRRSNSPEEDLKAAGDGATEGRGDNDVQSPMQTREVEIGDDAKLDGDALETIKHDNSKESNLKESLNQELGHLPNHLRVSSYSTRIKLPHTMRNSEASLPSRVQLNAIANSPPHGDSEATPTQSDRREKNSKKDISSSSTTPLLAQSGSQETQVMMLPKTPVDSLTEPQSVKQSPTSQGSSFQVLTSPETHDDVILFIKPEDFQTIKIEVISTLSFNPKKSEDFSCTLSINDRETAKGMWKVRKSYSQILSFDNEIRPVLEAFGLPPLPERSLFSSTVPAKVDARKQSLQHYFNSIFLIPHIPKLILNRICRYISLDFVNPLDDFKSGARLEGYLIRRYKGLGTTWKTRWCQVDGPSLEIYEFPGGPMIEQVRLTGSQIGRQSSDNVAEEKGYRHAFLILEYPKNKISSSTQKHFFCAELDKERDDWVNAMVEYTENDPMITQMNLDSNEQRNASRAVDLLNSPKTAHLSKEEDSKELKDVKKLRKRSLFPFRYKGQQFETEEEGTGSTLEEGGNNMSLEAHLAVMNLTPGQFKPVFGKELAEALDLSSRTFDGRLIPTVCGRCLDYLSKTGAIYEEGIFRLSGSASTIRTLKDQFNKDHDVDLFEHQLNPDIHTVAGLFKTYLRELPDNIFGNAAYSHMQLMFTSGNDAQPRSQIVWQMQRLINDKSNVTQGNFDFCFTVFRLLSTVVARRKTNLMSLRNICIVFVPTLRISLEVLSLCITDFDCIFLDGKPLDDDKRETLDLQIPSF